MTARDPNLNALWARLVLDELYASGVGAVCVCPGSRSAMLAWAASQDGRLEVTSHVDERSAGFFALGLARATGRPVALVCTSGSAAAHFFPAVVEADSDRVPLVVLSADRPAELQGCGAPQAMDQVGMFGRFVRAFVNILVPEADANVLRHVRGVVNRAVAAACGGGGTAAGPVHLNLPFREPLQPVVRDQDALAALPASATRGRAHGAPWLATLHGPALPPAHALDALAARLAAASRPLVVVGPMRRDAADAIVALAQRLGAPVLADPLSGLRQRRFDGLVSHRYDAWTRLAAVHRRLRPDLVLRFGASMTSKSTHAYRATHPDTPELLVDPDRRLHDYDHLAETLITAEPAALAEALLERLPASRPVGRWSRCVAALEEVVDRVVAETVGHGALWEGELARALVTHLPADAALFCASSMPIRDLDAFGGLARDGVRFLGNRGVNGIDGMIASTLGVAAGVEGPVVGLLGDVAFLHDVGSLLAARRALPEGRDLTLVVVDNRGGGIFAFLPVAAVWGEAEPLFTTPPGIALGPVAAAFGARVVEVGEREGLHRALDEAIGRPGLDVVIVHVDRDTNVARHRAHQAAVDAAVFDGSALWDGLEDEWER